jgi:hypothetical protein
VSQRKKVAIFGQTVYNDQDDGKPLRNSEALNEIEGDIDPNP